MAAMSMRLLVWSLRRRLSVTAERLGLAGCVLAVLVPLLVFAITLDTHLREELVLEQAAALHLRAQASDRTRAQPPAMSLEQELGAFEDQLPAADDRMQILADLFHLAQKHQLTLPRGEYQLQREDKSGLVRFQIVLPIKGDPGAIRRFVHEALATNSSLAFEALSLKRENLNHEAIDAKVQLILFMRPDTAGSGSSSPAAVGRTS